MKKIFVLNLRGNIIGDSVKECALFSLLKKQYPKSYIATTGGKIIREIHKNNPNIDQFHYLAELDKFTPKYCKMKKIFYHISALKKAFKLIKGYDLIVLTQKHKYPYVLLPKLRNIKFIEKEETDYKKYNTKIYFTKREENSMKKYLIKNKKKKIAINIESKDIKRCWPKKKYSKLIQELLIKGYDIYLLGTDKNYNKEIIKKYSGFIQNLVGKTTIRETALIIKNSDLYIGNDSGLSHIAATVNTNSLTILIDSDIDLINKKRGYKAIKIRKPKINGLLNEIENVLQN
jgi:ADP-heptose:LPS heptosyltransferase